MSSRIRKNAIFPFPILVEGELANRLVHHLETKPHLIQSKRVERILHLLSRLGENEWDLYTFSQLREPLQRYEWHYGLTLSRGKGLGTELRFTKNMSEEDEWEHNAVRFLLSLVPHRINRLRRCAYDGCKGWFFAEKRDDQTFCKRGSCRQNHYDDDPKRREKKKANMRENRKWHREHDRRAKDRVQLKKARNRGLK